MKNQKSYVKIALKGDDGKSSRFYLADKKRDGRHRLKSSGLQEATGENRPGAAHDECDARLALKSSKVKNQGGTVQ